MTPYTLIRSKRRTLSIGISRDGELIARAPRLMPIGFIESFIDKKRSWIERHQAEIIKKQLSGKQKKYNEGEIVMMKKILKEYLDMRVARLFKGKGLPVYTSMKVTKSERRWGSCSGKNGLCFSYRLAEYLPGVSLSSLGTKDFFAEYFKKDTRTEYDKGDELKFIDAIIYHELAHLKEKNHGKRFWSLVYSMMPDYERVMKDMRNLD